MDFQRSRPARNSAFVATFKLDGRMFGVLPRHNPRVDDGAIIAITEKPPAAQKAFDVDSTLKEAIAILSSALTILVLTKQLGD